MCVHPNDTSVCVDDAVIDIVCAQAEDGLLKRVLHHAQIVRVNNLTDDVRVREFRFSVESTDSVRFIRAVNRIGLQVPLHETQVCDVLRPGQALVFFPQRVLLSVTGNRNRGHVRSRFHQPQMRGPR